MAARDRGGRFALGCWGGALVAVVVLAAAVVGGPAATSAGSSIPGSSFRAGLLVVAAIAATIALASIRLGSRAERASDAARRARYDRIGAGRRDAWRALFEAEGLAGRVEDVAPRARPAIRIETKSVAAAAIPIGASRIGGAPDVPPDFAWPLHAGTRLPFVAEIDLGEVHRAGTFRSAPDTTLPAQGHALFFYSLDAGVGAVRLVRAGLALERAEGRATYPPCAVTFVAYDDPPDPDGALDDDARDRWLAIRAHLSSGHKLLGHGEWIQDPAERDGERLLLQLGDDDGAGARWGDAGTLYFLIGASDLRAGDLHLARCEIQSG